MSIKDILQEDTISGNIELKYKSKIEILDFKRKKNNVIEISLRRDIEKNILIEEDIKKEKLNEELKEKILKTKNNYKITKIKEVPKKYKFENQEVTDIFIYGYINGGLKILMGERKYPPIGYGLFRGMVEEDEDAKKIVTKNLLKKHNYKKMIY